MMKALSQLTMLRMSSLKSRVGRRSGKDNFIVRDWRSKTVERPHTGTQTQVWYSESH